MTLLNRVERRAAGRMVGVALQQGLENQSRSIELLGEHVIPALSD